MQFFSKNYYFLPTDKHAYVCVSGRKKCYFSRKFGVRTNEWSLRYPKPISSVIRQKGESQNGYFKKTKHIKFSEKPTLLTPWYAHVICFLETPVLRFTLLTYYRRFRILSNIYDGPWITNPGVMGSKPLIRWL